MKTYFTSKRNVLILPLLFLLAGGFREGGEVYNGDFDINKPISWHQAQAPYSSKPFPGCRSGDYAECSCGVHALAALMIKSGAWELGKSAEDAAEKAVSAGILEYEAAYSFSSENVKSFSDGKWELVMWQATKDLSREKSYEIIKSELEAGHYIWLAVNIYKTIPEEMKSLYDVGGHAVAVDYIDEEGRIVVIDSGGRYKYLDDVGGGETDGIAVFKSDLNSNQSPKFWLGETPTTVSSSSNNESKPNQQGVLSNIGYDDDKWKDPVIQYDDSRYDGNQKGIDRGGSIWDFLFGE